MNGSNSAYYPFHTGLIVAQDPDPVQAFEYSKLLQDCMHGHRFRTFPNLIYTGVP